MSILTRFVAALVLAITCLIAAGDIMFAGDSPGEGFTAAILMLLVVALQFVVLGRPAVLGRLPQTTFSTALTCGAALLFVLVAAPLAAGAPLLAGFKVPLGPFTLSGSTLFDMGVFLVVWGAMLLAFSNLEAPET